MKQTLLQSKKDEKPRIISKKTKLQSTLYMFESFSELDSLGKISMVLKKKLLSHLVYFEGFLFERADYLDSVDCEYFT